jgi:hypothetical protein
MRSYSVGDSILVAPQGASFPTTTGGVVGDTASAVVSAPSGSTLHYICALHPWMQATIKVVRDRDDS